MSDVEVLGTAVLLRGDAVRDAYFATASALRTLRTARRSPSKRLQDLATLLGECVAAQRNGQADTQDPKTLLSSEHAIGCTRAAEILGITPRSVRRRAVELGGVQSPNGRWSFDADEIRAFAS